MACWWTLGSHAISTTIGFQKALLIWISEPHSRDRFPGTGRYRPKRNSGGVTFSSPVQSSSASSSATLTSSETYRSGFLMAFQVGEWKKIPATYMSYWLSPAKASARSRCLLTRRFYDVPRHGSDYVEGGIQANGEGCSP